MPTPSLKLLGDVHAGKVFQNNVPIHRRGEREQEVLLKLLHELLIVPLDTSIHMQVGDLFDQFKVSNEVVWSVAEAYIEAARMNPNVTYFLYPGNHDLSRDTTKISSLQILDAMLAPCKNVQIVWEPVVAESTIGIIGIMPWSPLLNASELAQELVRKAEGRVMDYVFCHCDTTGDGPNLIPLKELSGHAKTVITGHVHTPETYKAYGIDVIVTGSMQPYSHGEDPDHKRYLTLTRAELDRIPASELEDKYIRVKLTKDEVAPDAPNCMGFQILYEGEEEITPENVAVEFEKFSTRGLFQGCLTEAGVTPETAAKVLEKFDETN